ncbi:MAG TPA: hypothetical protein VM866_00370 [Pyrinomonadaceae bacterium]|nr:hypothetical protein [Pyrinomonadaceae bacterium]
MNLNNKILPVAVVAALLGGSAGAFMMRPANTNDVAAANAARQLTPVAPTHSTLAVNPALSDQSLAGSNQLAANDLGLTGETSAYRQGFVEGVRAARDEELSGSRVSQSSAVPATRVVYSNGRSRSRAARSSDSRRVYYDYNQPRERSFWQKHRDKLTVAAGAGGGAVLGGLIGGKKGAAIGALAGGGGSALYTYKLRKKNRNY